MRNQSEPDLSGMDAYIGDMERDYRVPGYRCSCGRWHDVLGIKPGVVAFDQENATIMRHLGKRLIAQAEAKEKGRDGDHHEIRTYDKASDRNCCPGLV